MNIVVCVKLVPDTKDLEVNNDGSISLDEAEWMIGEYDLNAIEAGVKLCEIVGGKVVALSVGSSLIDNSKLKKNILSYGPDELVLVADDALIEADTNMTSTVLVSAVQKLEQPDIILCGEGSADYYYQQVGLQVGEKLGWPTLNAIKKIQPMDNKLLVERNLENEIEFLEVPLPATLSVTTDINQPRLPTMMEILKANRKPITVWRLADLGIMGNLSQTITTISTKAPERRQRKKIIISGSPDDAAKELIDHLSQERVL
jgi:electron transfer flavoprotein beta subunit